jgi:hypothetical protein
MTVKTRAQLIADAESALPNNVAGEISPADVRQRIKDLADSARLTEDVGSAASKDVGTGANDVAAGNHGHAAATGSVPGFMAATDKSKLDAIAAGATANDTDANLKNRANHTGSQAISTVGGLQASLDGKQSTSQQGAANGYASLDGTAKVPMGQIPDALIGSVRYEGTWNAATNTPPIPAAGAGNKGFYYIVSVAGTTAVNGINDWEIGDWIISDGSVWGKVDNTDQVMSVAGKRGIVILAKGDVGLDSVDNTSDASKPVSTAQQAALNGKADTVHTHTTAQVAGLDAALAGKANTSSLGSIAGRTYSSGTGDPSGGSDGNLYLKYT